MSYPLEFAPKDSPLWGYRIPRGGTGYRSQDDAYEGWELLVPPAGMLPEGVVPSSTADVSILRKCTGFMKKDEEVLPFCIRNDLLVVPLPSTADAHVFGPAEELAVAAKNEGTLYSRTVPVIPPRYFKSVSEKLKYHYLQRNFSQLQIPPGIPGERYLNDTPKAIPFDPSAMDSIVFDLKKFFDDKLETSGPPLINRIAPISSSSSKPKRPTPEPDTPAPAASSTAGTTAAATADDAAPSSEPNKKRKSDSSRRKKSKAPAPAPPPAPSDTPTTTAAATPQGSTNAHTNGQPNQQQVMDLLRSITNDKRFKAENPLNGISLGKNMTTETRAFLLKTAQFLHSYTPDLLARPQEDVLDMIFG